MFYGSIRKAVAVLFTAHAFPAPAHFLLHYVAAQISPTQRGTAAADDWRPHDKESPLALRAVAQTVFGCPATAGVIERDFCITDKLRPRKRGSLCTGPT